MALVPATFDAGPLAAAAAAAEQTSEWGDDAARVQALLETKLEKEEIATRDGAGSQKVAYMESWRVIEKVRAPGLCAHITNPPVDKPRSLLQQQHHRSSLCAFSGGVQAQQILGYDGWSSEIRDIQKEYEGRDDKQTPARWSVGYSCTIRVSLKCGTFHDDVGFGSVINERDRGKAIENARKEAVSDGVKRALRYFGAALGNSVYDKAHVKAVTAPKPRLPPQPAASQAPPQQMQQPQFPPELPPQQQGGLAPPPQSPQGAGPSMQRPGVMAPPPQQPQQQPPQPTSRRAFSVGEPPAAGVSGVAMAGQTMRTPLAEAHPAQPMASAPAGAQGKRPHTADESSAEQMQKRHAQQPPQAHLQLQPQPQPQPQPQQHPHQPQQHPHQPQQPPPHQSHQQPPLYRRWYQE